MGSTDKRRYKFACPNCGSVGVKVDGVVATCQNVYCKHSGRKQMFSNHIDRTNHIPNQRWRAARLSDEELDT